MSGKYLKNSLKKISRFGVLCFILFFVASVFFAASAEAAECGRAETKAKYETLNDLKGGSYSFLCENGWPSGYKESATTFNWKCGDADGTGKVSCSTKKYESDSGGGGTDGKCGSADGKTFDSAYDLGAGGQCSSGTLSNRQYEEISDTKFKQTWDCSSKDGGETATDCYAFVDEGDGSDEGYCGDSTVDTTEDCDDGNTTSGDGCSADCKTETEGEGTGKYCGDGNTDTIEDCDDGNTTSGDGCSADCETETEGEGDGSGDGDGGKKTIEYDNPLNTDNIIDIVKRVADYFYYVAIAIVPIITIYAAVLFLTAGDDASQVGKAKKMMIWLVVGIAILLIGSGVITLLKDILNVD